jgi:ABC-type branched-subunit amino acid transport system substrate-binding protein
MPRLPPSWQRPRKGKYAIHDRGDAMTRPLIVFSRRHTLLGLGGGLLVAPRLARACAEPDHPCGPTGGALVPSSGPGAQTGAQGEAGIQAILDYLRQHDPQHYRNLQFIIIETGAEPATAIQRTVDSLQQRNPPAALIVLDFYLDPKQVAKLGKTFTTPFITILGEPDPVLSGWVFSIAPTAEQTASGAAGYLQASGLVDKAQVALITTPGRQRRALALNQAMADAGFVVGPNVTLPEPPQAAMEAARGIIASAAPAAWLLSLPGKMAIMLARDIARGRVGGGPIVVDAWLGDPETILRGVGAPSVTVISGFAPDQVARGPLGAAVASGIRERLKGPPTAAAVLAATAAQVLAQAATTIPANHEGEGPATRDALRGVVLPADALMVPWRNVRFDPKTLQNIDATVVALAWRNERAVTVPSVMR